MSEGEAPMNARLFLPLAAIPEQYLKQHPLCVKCLEEGKITIATVVDHIIPHKGAMVLFWQVENHQALCQRCHSIKTAKEDGGFGKY
jgi:5-methylcytosine-specific restriction protein A